MIFLQPKKTIVLKLNISCRLVEETTNPNWEQKLYIGAHDHDL